MTVLPTPSLVFLIPGDLSTLTGGYAYDRQIIHGLRALGWTVEVVSLGDGFPWPDADTLNKAAHLVAAIPDGQVVVADGLALGVMPEIVTRHAQRLHWVALVHHPLALETGLHEAQRQQLFQSERAALSKAAKVIVTSHATSRALATYGVDASRIQVVAPGTPLAPLTTGSERGNTDDKPTLSLLCVATVTPRKGHAVLIEALAGLQHHAWTLHCVGSLQRDPGTVKAVRSAIEQHGLGSRVHLHGEVSSGQLTQHYARADAFMLPSFHEGYGMVLAEALAHGLPVVSTTAGAIPDTVPADAGLLVPAGDAQALRHALARLLTEPGLRAQLAGGARAARMRLPDWPQAVARFAQALHPLPPAPNTLSPQDHHP